jgi:hypothetical protein
MSRESLTAAFLVLTALGGASCATTSQQKSTGTNWIECKADTDCAAHPGASCGDADVCVDRDGNRIPSGTTSDPADGGGNGGSQSTGGATGSGGGGAPVTASGGTSPGTGGSGNGGGGVSASTKDCFSPGQNLDHAYDTGAAGCRCAESTPSVCVKGTRTAVALECTGGHWISVEDGACGGCWTPDQPELALAMPSRGCACPLEDGSKCFQTAASGSMRALCFAGKWTIDTNTPTCDACDSDASCGFGGMCTEGHCAPTACDVDGVRYAVGAGPIPDPFSCNTCTCESGGGLVCTEVNCPVECPAGTTAGHACVACGPTDGCALTRTGCLPRCEAASDCTTPGTFCDTQTHLCRAGCP